MPLYEDLLNNYDAKLIAGGAAQNSARGAQYILPPNSVVFLGGAGDDKYSAIMHDAVKAAGLRVEYRVDPEQKTGRCGVVITGHNRSLCTDLGAANHYDLDHLKKPEIWSLVENAEVFYIGGYHFTGEHKTLSPNVDQSTSTRDKANRRSVSPCSLPPCHYGACQTGR